MSAIRIFVPQDTGAVSVGADRVAGAIEKAAQQRGLSISLVRNGSRGAYWLEPLVEVETPGGRVAYGPVAPGDVASLLAAGFLDGAPHPLRLGPVDEIPFGRVQHRITFERVGVVDPLSPDDYRRNGGLAGLSRALAMRPREVIEQVAVSGLRGRGGAGFPAGIKWRTAADAPSGRKYIVCNADEGDSGTFADRMLMEGDPFCLIEGMVIACVAVGATHGFIYIRSEYPRAVSVMRRAVEIARDIGLLGDNVGRVAGLDGPAFDIDVRVGAGAYICGEETSLLESLEGRRGQVRARPPLPALKGLFGRPTVINNVLTLATVPWILSHGGQAYAAHGTGRSRGAMPFQLSGNVRRGGLYELPFGLSLRELVMDIGGGTASGRSVRAVQVGGPLGAYFPERLLDTRLDYESMAEAGGMLGHGGVVVFDDTVDMAAQARFAFEFCAIESCGKCTPCRIGSRRGVETLDKVIGDLEREANIALVEDLCATLTDGSLCALGGLTPLPVLSALRYFPEDFRRAAAP